jgi:subtilisin
MNPDHPAWSEAFSAEQLRSIEAPHVLQAITPEWAWRSGTGAGVKVCVIDSGVDATHPDVRNVAGGGVVEKSEDGPVFVKGPHEDLFGHGTACAGIIRGIAPEVELYSVRVLGAQLRGNGYQFLKALEWALDNHMHVINMSLSTGKAEYFAPFHELADRAYFSHTALVSAANNIQGPSYPSLYSAVFSVAASEEKDPFTFYYNPEPPVEFGAAGINVKVPWLDHGYLTTVGNSFAAPVIAGIVARILSAHPGLTIFQLKTILAATAANSSIRVPAP